MVTQLNTTNKQYATTDNTVNRFGRKKGDIKVRPGDTPGIIFVDCPANEYGKYPPIEFAIKDELNELDPIKSRDRWLAGLSPEERKKELALSAAKKEARDELNKKYKLNFSQEKHREWMKKVYDYDYDYYDRIYGTDEEIFGAYEELYGSK
jgi:hypothetical protein